MLSRPCSIVFVLVLLAAVGVGAAPANLTPEWLSRLPVGASLSAGLAGIVVDEAGNSYVSGTSGLSSNTDITTAAYGPDGSLLWSHTFDGPGKWHDQSRGLALAPGGLLYVVGDTPGPGFYAQVLLLAYDTASGNLVRALQYTSGPGTSEHGGSVATDAAGNVYIAGGTVGDGADAMILAFDPAGQLLWKRTWDGPAQAPYSQDDAIEVLVHPDGNPVALIYGVMGSLHADYVVVKYAAGDGTTIWDRRWGGSGEDSPRDMEIDAQGDVYVTGTGLNFRNEYSTIKLRGSDGALLWQGFDSGGFRNGAAALILDGAGGAYVTGTVDPDGDVSNQNDNVYTVKRDAASGARLWTHSYGANCLYCFDAAYDVGVDSAGHAFVAGTTSSPPYAGDGILLVLDAQTGVETDRSIVAGAPTEAVYPREIRLDPDSNLLLGGTFYNANTGYVDLSVARYAALGGGTGIPCADTRKFVTRCVNPGSGNRLQARLTLTDTSHDGEPVTIEVDGVPRVVPIDGFQATLVVGGMAPGSHSVELTDPAGCFPVQTPVCPAN
jgi:hypothetical protein